MDRLGGWRQLEVIVLFDCVDIGHSLETGASVKIDINGPSTGDAGARPPISSEFKLMQIVKRKTVHQQTPGCIFTYSLVNISKPFCMKKPEKRTLSTRVLQGLTFSPSAMPMTKTKSNSQTRSDLKNADP